MQLGQCVTSPKPVATEVSEVDVVECEQAFDEANSLITSEQVLVHYDPDLPIRVACDASA